MEKFKNSLKKEFDSEPIYSEKYLKAEKKNLITETSTQVFTMLKCQNNVFIWIECFYFYLFISKFDQLCI